MESPKFCAQYSRGFRSIFLELCPQEGVFEDFGSPISRLIFQAPVTISKTFKPVLTSPNFEHFNINFTNFFGCFKGTLAEVKQKNGKISNMHLAGFDRFIHCL